MPGPMDPESSDSDVSVGGGDEYRFASPLTAPIPLPPPASKHALESTDAVNSRLDELQRVEDHNDKKYKLLKAKRARKDDKIRRRREIQDQKWTAIMEARKRRDARIEARRRREDAAFTQFNQELDDEETNLRLRLKRLKRGLPPDESPKPGGRSISSSSMSPPGPALSTIPPPPKRHQVGPPGQPDAINPSISRPSPQANQVAPAKGNFPAPAPPYSFARDYSSPYSTRPYHHHSAYPGPPTTASPTLSANGPSHNSHPSTDRSPFAHVGRPTSPLSRPVTGTLPSTQSPVTSAVNSNPPRQVYDTRPPPTTSSSGFASVNAPPPPPASSFATINPRTTGTPPASQAPLSKPTGEVEGNKTPSHQTNNGIENNRFHPYSSNPNSAAATPTGSNNTKRTPSTTHPYQMSEAFANRHHHCERVDPLNRGIWTSHGIGGTADNPTGPPVEMYLRCNHDGCARIDWRTVHGLQCHIVKNHEQPKGTIGSLEKALERYGVPVAEVEDYEREHGKGTAGTMADPKNLKMKLKTKIQDFSRKGTPGSYGIDPDARPAGYRPSPAATDDSPTTSDDIKKSPAAGPTNGYHNSAFPVEAGRLSAPQSATASPASAFTAVRPSWMAVTTPAPMPTRVEPPEAKSLQGDFGASAIPSSGQPQIPQTGPPKMAPFPTLPSTVKADSPRLEPSTAVPPSTTPFAAINQQPTTSVPAPESLPPAPQSEPTEMKLGDGKTDGQHPSVQETAAPAPAPVTKTEDVEMTGMAESSQERKEENVVNGEAKAVDETIADKPEPTEQAEAAEQPEQSEPKSDDHSETIEVGGNPAKDVTGPVTRRSTIQSPTITTRSLAATTPGSARRLGRRSSAARQSVDIDSEAGKAAPVSEDGDKEEKDIKEEKTERMETRRRGLRRSTKY